MQIKQCNTCHRELPVSEFYSRPQTADGYAYYCKECYKVRNAQYRVENIDRLRKYDNVRGRYLHRVKVTMERVKNRKKGVPDSKYARGKLNRAIQKGVMVKPHNCQECGSLGRLDAHHADYSKPLKVVWLCRSCHATLHSGVTPKAEALRAKYPLQA